MHASGGGVVERFWSIGGLEMTILQGAGSGTVFVRSCVLYVFPARPAARDRHLVLKIDPLCLVMHFFPSQSGGGLF